MDYASNRYLISEPTPGEGALLTLNALLLRKSPTLDLTLQPMVSVQRYTTDTASDTTDRAINGMAEWRTERSTFDLQTGYSNLSALTSELATTGVVEGDTRQRQENAQGSWQLQQSERRQLTFTGGYADVAYSGQQAIYLVGYRYPSVSISEQLNLWPRTSLTLTATGGELLSKAAGAPNSDDYEITLGVDHHFSPKTELMVSAGGSEETSSGVRTYGYVGQFLATRAGERNEWKISYQRSVTPNGLGGLVRRNQGSASFSRQLAPHLTGGVALFANRDDEVFFFNLFERQRRYESATAKLGWNSGETSTFSLQGGVDHGSQAGPFPIPSAHGWHLGLSYTWVPKPSTVSR